MGEHLASLRGCEWGLDGIHLGLWAGFRSQQESNERLIGPTTFQQVKSPTVLRMRPSQSRFLPSLLRLGHSALSLLGDSSSWSPVMGNATWKNPGLKSPLQNDINLLVEVWKDARIHWSQEMEISHLRTWTATLFFSFFIYWIYWGDTGVISKITQVPSIQFFIIYVLTMFSTLRVNSPSTTLYLNLPPSFPIPSPIASDNN